MIVLSKVVRDREKAFVFCQTPASTLLIYTALKLKNIDVVLLATHQPDRERRRMIDEFNFNSERKMVLVTVYALASTGLNLQKDCWRVHCVESSHNLGIKEQAIGRVCGIGNPAEFVWATEYSIPDTFDDRAMCRHIAKALYRRLWPS